MKYLVSVFILISSVCYAQNNNLPDTTKWSTRATNDFSISFPSSWVLDTSGVMGSELFIFSPPDGSGDKFRENVNVMASQMPAGVDGLDTVVSVSIKEIETMANDYHILESKRYHAAAGEFHRIEFTAKQGVFDLRFVQYYFIARGKNITITLTTEKSKFAEYEKTGLAILNSFVPVK